MANVTPEIEFSKRHLHWDAVDENTVCGCRRWIPVRAGSRFWKERGYQSVHWSKARKATDCAACRYLVREDIKSRRQKDQ